MNIIKLFYCFWALFLLPFGLFAQQVKWEEIEIKNDLFFIEGTLSYCTDKEYQPLVIYVAGSGNIDRNGNQKPMINASYIQQLSDSLTSHCVAMFRYDKRTANPKNLALKEIQNIRFNDFIDDVVKVVNYFKNDKRFSEIILIGHSQGSLTSMLALQRVKADKFISIAGAAEPVERVLTAQLTQQNKVLADKAKEYFSELKQTDTIQNVHPFLMNIFAPVNQKFLKSWNEYNPISEIKKLKIPILLINGTADLQIPVSAAEKLHKAHSNSHLVIIKNMTHTLKIIEKPNDNILTYTQSDFPISQKLVENIIQFVNQ